MKSLPTLSGAGANAAASVPKATLPSAAVAPTSMMRVRMLVTPQQAKAWLDQSNTSNRPMSDLHWTAIAVDMMEGRWKYNGDAIRFSSAGVLLDGQHRLRACVEAGLPFETDVVFGLDPTVMDTIDIGRVRRASDLVSLKGVENATVACAAATLLLIHDKFGLHRVQNPDAHPTKTEVIAYVVNNPRLPAVAGRVGNWTKRLVAPRIAVACYYLFSAQNQELADRFFKDFAQGVNLARTSPAYYLRERMVEDRTSKRKLQILEILALFCKAWIAYRDGVRMKLLRWAPGNNETFPDISVGAGAAQGGLG